MCACNHLTTFALLSLTTDLISSSSSSASLANEEPSGELQIITGATGEQAAGTQLVAAQPAQQPPRMPLDGVENELILANGRLLYLAKVSASRREGAR